MYFFEFFFLLYWLSEPPALRWNETKKKNANINKIKIMMWLTYEILGELSVDDELELDWLPIERLLSEEWAFEQSEQSLIQRRVALELE